MTSHKLRTALLAGVLALTSGAFVHPTAARADDWDHDRRWRAHERHEAREHARREYWHRHWDHDYWDHDHYYRREVYVERPPTAIYEPAPPPGVGFAFHFGD
jgi:hypothetical protein